MDYNTFSSLVRPISYLPYVSYPGTWDTLCDFYDEKQVILVFMSLAHGATFPVAPLLDAPSTCLNVNGLPYFHSVQQSSISFVSAHTIFKWHNQKSLS